jgi:transcription elongation factor Elf1
MRDRRRQTDRRKGQRRKQGHDCPKCGADLIYDITNPSHMELFCCKGCNQKYILIGRELLRIK